MKCIGNKAPKKATGTTAFGRAYKARNGTGRSTFQFLVTIMVLCMLLSAQVPVFAEESIGVMTDSTQAAGSEGSISEQADGVMAENTALNGGGYANEGTVEETESGTIENEASGDEAQGIQIEALNEDVDHAEIEPLTIQSVRIRDTGECFDTLDEALAVTNTRSYSTIEIIDESTLAASTAVTSHVIIVGVGGAHTVTMPDSHMLSVVSGGSLTLGDGTLGSPVTLIATDTVVHVTNGILNINAGATLINIRNGTGALPVYSQATVRLEGPAARGSFSGGRIEGYLALWAENGATINQISGGEFIGAASAVELHDNTTRIDVISGGTFVKTDARVSRGCFYVDNKARIGEICGGTFRSEKYNSLLLIRGGWVDTISGGTFISLDSQTSGTISIYSDNEGKTGIGTFSGGYVSGGDIGIWLCCEERTSDSVINTICGGVIEGRIGIENDRGGVIRTISGGNLTGSSYGLMNVNIVNEIGGQSSLVGGSSGIWNYRGSRIDLISGGYIGATSLSGNGIFNSGTIDRISGGEFYGSFCAINSNGMNAGRLNVVSGGVFRSVYDCTFNLAYELQLEPGLTGTIGDGRYWSQESTIFNDESLVEYPGEYYMSDYADTVPVAGIAAVQFRYLRMADPPTFTVTVLDSYAADTGAGDYEEGEMVTIDAGKRPGYTFEGWTTNDGVVCADADSAMTTFIMPAQDVEMCALWAPVTYTVTWLPGDHGVFAAQSTSGLKPGDLTPTSPATPGEKGWMFTGWSPSPTTTVMGDAIYTAQWKEKPQAEAPTLFTVRFVDWDGTVLKSQQVQSGADAIAPSNPSRVGYTFDRWDRAFTNVQSDLTVTALYRASGGGNPGGNTPGEGNPGGNTPGGSTPGGSTPGGGTPSIDNPSTGNPSTGDPVLHEVTDRVDGEAPVIHADNMETTFDGNSMDSGSWALINFILAVVGLMVGIIAVLRALLRRQTQQNQYAQRTESYDRQEKRSILLWLTMVILIALVGIVMFLCTEDMTRQMALVDVWTSAQLIILALEALVFALAFRHKKTAQTIC